MKADARASTGARRRDRPGRAPLLAALALLVLPSCAAPVVVLSAGLAVAQLGTTAYVNGELQTSVMVEFNAVVDAATFAENSLGLTPTSRRIGDREATVSAYDLGKRSITVTVTQRTSNVCKISIRVGFWGDQSMSRLVMAQMQKDLVAKGFLSPPVINVPSGIEEESPGGM